MLHKMKLAEDPFNRMKDGKKTIEVRLYDDKRKKIKVGDAIIFLKLPKLDESVNTKVIDLTRFNSFKDVFETFDKSKFGHPEDITIEDQIEGMREAYSEEQEKEKGVLAIHIKLLE